MIEITNENYGMEIEKAKTAVIIDFWAEWCMPCRALGPIFENASKLYEKKVKFAKLNVDNNQELAVKFGVMSIPTLIITKNGVEINRSIGSMGLDKLKEFIEKNI